MSTWYQPHTRHSAAELQISSFDLSPKAVIYPCFHTHLSPDCVPPMPTVAEGLSANIQGGAGRLRTKEGSWELQMLGVGRVWMERIVWLCGWK